LFVSLVAATTLTGLAQIRKARGSSCDLGITLQVISPVAVLIVIGAAMVQYGA